MHNFVYQTSRGQIKKKIVTIPNAGEDEVGPSFITGGNVKWFRDPENFGGFLEKK